MGVIQWEHLFLKKGVIHWEHFINGVIKWESILKMGIIRWGQSVKNKKGSLSDRRFEMGVNVAAHTRHVFLRLEGDAWSFMHPR